MAEAKPHAHCKTGGEQKEIKRQALLELVDYCDNIRNGFNDASIICDVLNMIACNIFRALPPMVCKYIQII